MKYTKLCVAAIGSLILFNACNTNEKKQTAAEDTTVVVDTISPQEMQQITIREDSALLYNKLAPSFIKHLEAQRVADWQQYQLVNMGVIKDSQMVQSFRPTPQYLKAYQSLLRISPNGNYILNLGAQTNDPKDTAMANDPDVNVTLLNVKMHTSTSVMYGGAAVQVLSGDWLNNDTYALLGVYPTKNPDVNDTILEIHNIQSNFVRDYKYQSK